jgi:hypothetical protein
MIMTDKIIFNYQFKKRFLFTICNDMGYISKKQPYVKRYSKLKKSFCITLIMINFFLNSLLLLDLILELGFTLNGTGYVEDT